MGGSTAMNEGAEVAYTISPTSSTTSGVYLVWVQAVLYPKMMFCATDFELVVGNAQPNGAGGTCGMYHQGGFVNGTLYAEVTGASGSFADTP